MISTLLEIPSRRGVSVVTSDGSDIVTGFSPPESPPPVAPFVLYPSSIPTYPTGWTDLVQRILFAVITSWLVYHAIAPYRLTRRGPRAS
jgi:hypothetical protein